jgi:hypothetical protein
MHPTRLPLGGGWRGVCTAGEVLHTPSDFQLREQCNLGYAASCTHLPRERSCDAVRFGVRSDRDSRIVITYVYEADHRPAGHGVLEYNCGPKTWVSSHSDVRVQKMAECFMENYLDKNPRNRLVAIAPSAAN